MEDLIRLLPRKLVAAVTIPFFGGLFLLALLVSSTPSGRTFVFLLFVGGVMVMALLGLGLTLLVRQSRGLEKQRESGE